MHDGRDNIELETVDACEKDLRVIIDSNLTFRDHSSNGRHYVGRDL